MAQLADQVPWGRSTADEAFLEWIAPTLAEREPKPPSGYVVSLARLHERGFGVPAERFVHALCHHYKVELHNFSHNVFVSVCEGYLGEEALWNLWKHLFWGELYTERVHQGPRRAVHAGGLTLHVRENRRDLYIASKMTSNNRDWSKAWF
jgi:hypothetical protein